MKLWPEMNKFRRECTDYHRLVYLCKNCWTIIEWDGSSQSRAVLGLWTDKSCHFIHTCCRWLWGKIWWQRACNAFDQYSERKLIRKYPMIQLAKVLGITFELDYLNRMVHLSMLGYLPTVHSDKSCCSTYLFTHVNRYPLLVRQCLHKNPGPSQAWS